MVSVSDFDPKKMVAFMSDYITGVSDFSSAGKPVSGSVKTFSSPFCFLLAWIVVRLYI
jgi:hypothetical protein